MLYYLLLLCSPILSCVQSIAQKQYSLKREARNEALFAALTTLCALMFFVVTSGFQLDFDGRLLPYALTFAVGYACAWVGTLLALRYGELAISTLIISFSLLLPTVYGFATGDSASPAVLLGMALLCAAMVLVNHRRGGKVQISLKWIVSVAVAFVGNGTAAIMSNRQKQVLGDGYTHEFMIIALSGAFVLLMIYSMFNSRGITAEVKACIPLSIINGVANAAMNLIILTLIGNIPTVVLYPTNSALGMVFTFLLAYIYYKERFTRPQYVGYALGVAAIILLNIG